MITGTSRFHVRPGSPSRRRPQTSNPDASGSTASSSTRSGCSALQEIERRAAILGREHREAVVRELLLEERAHRRLLLDHQDRLACHEAKVAARETPGQMSFHAKSCQRIRSVRSGRIG